MERADWLADAYCSEFEKNPKLSLTFTENLLARIKSEARTPVQRCMECHSEKDRNLRVGPYLPFHDPKKLLEMDDGWIATQIGLLTSDHQKEVKDGGLRMPYAQRPLTDEEKRVLFDYLQSNKE